MSLQDKELKNINNHLIWKSSRNGWYKVRGPSPSTTMGVILTFTGKGEREFQSNQGIFFLSVSLQWKSGQRKATKENTRIHLLQLCEGKPKGWMLKHKNKNHTSFM